MVGEGGKLGRQGGHLRRASGDQKGEAEFGGEGKRRNGGFGRREQHVCRPWAEGSVSRKKEATC